MEKKVASYIITTIVLSFALFFIIGGLFKTNDGTISYFLSLISSSILVDKCYKIMRNNKV